MPTLLSAVKYKGNGLISAKESEIEILPALANTGIVFVSKQTGKKVQATVSNVLDSSQAVTLGSPEFHVKMVEHLMAALALAKVTDAEIIIDTDEMPIGDGSARLYYDLIKSAGIEAHSDQRKFDLKQPVGYSYKHTSIDAIPYDAFRISYMVNYINSLFSYSWYKWDSKVDKPEDILDARTFGYTKDLSLFQSKGMALGVTLNNTVGLNEDGTFTTELRYYNEPVRHKILDLIGDIYLSGVNPLDINAHIIAIECGHTQHIKLSTLLKDNIIPQ